MLIAAVAPAHVVDHLVAPVLAEIDVKVGHGLALDVEKALEDQAVGDGVDVGDGHAEGGQAAGAGAAARAHRDLLALGPVDEVGHDQEVAGKAHLLDHADLHVQPVAVLFLLLVVQAPDLADVIEPFFQSLAAGLLEQALQALAFGHREDGKVVGAEFQFQVAPPGHLQGVGHRLGTVGELARHLVGRLEVELVGGEAEPLGIVDGAAGLDAEQDLVRVGLLAVEVVAVVGGHQLDAQLPAQLHEALVGHLLFRDAVFLQLEVEAVAKDLLQLDRLGPGAVRVVVGEAPGDLAVQAGGEGDQALLVPEEHLLVDARLVVEPLGLGNGGQFHQVLVAGPVHGQQDDMEVVARGPVLQEPALLGDVELAAHQGPDAGLFRLFVEFQGPVHGAVIGDRHGLHVVFPGAVDEIGQPDGTVQHGVLGMDVEMDKWSRHVRWCDRLWDRAGVAGPGWGAGRGSSAQGESSLLRDAVSGQ